MNKDVEQMYELNLRKNYDLLDTKIAKSTLFENSYLADLIETMDNILSTIEKDSKNYIITLTLNNKKFPSEKIKQINQKLLNYQKKIKSIKKKQSLTENFYNENALIGNQVTYFNSFNKIQESINVCSDIENMSQNILEGLNNQENQMKNTCDKIEELNDDVDNSQSIIGSMIRKNNYDKKIITFVGTFLSIIVLVCIIYKIVIKLKKQK